MRLLTCAIVTTTFAAATAGCGDDTPAGDSAGTDWRDADACSLLTDDEVAGMLGDLPASTPSADAWEAPACSWGETSTYGAGLRIRVWDPPAPEIFDRYDVVDAGPWEARVIASRDRGCELEVAAEPAWVSVDVDLPAAPDPSDRAGLCDRAARLAIAAAERISG